MRRACEPHRSRWPDARSSVPSTLTPVPSRQRARGALRPPLTGSSILGIPVRSHSENPGDIDPSSFGHQGYDFNRTGRKFVNLGHVTYIDPTPCGITRSAKFRVRACRPSGSEKPASCLGGQTPQGRSLALFRQHDAFYRALEFRQLISQHLGRTKACIYQGGDTSYSLY